MDPDKPKDSKSKMNTKAKAFNPSSKKNEPISQQETPIIQPVCNQSQVEEGNYINQNQAQPLSYSIDPSMKNKT